MGSLEDSLYILEKTKNYSGWIYDNIKVFLGDDVLEAGCGTGNLFDYFIDGKRKVTGVDIEPRFVEIAAEKYKNEPGVEVLLGDFMRDGSILKGRVFDTVILLNVLEHIEDDKKAAGIVYDLTAKGGRIVMLIPALNFIYGELDRGLGHYRRYNKKNARALLTGAGFEAEKLFYMNFVGAAGWFINSRIFKRRSFPRKQPVIFDRLMVPFLKPFEKIVKPVLGQSLIAVGRKY